MARSTSARRGEPSAALAELANPKNASASRYSEATARIAWRKTSRDVQEPSKHRGLHTLRLEPQSILRGKRAKRAGQPTLW